MATFDPDRREIVLRIIYDGAATAGKTANLRSLYAAFGRRAQGELYTPAETTTGRTLYFDWLELLGGQVDDWPVRCQVLAVPGQFALAERRYRLLRSIDAAVVVCESTPRGVRAARHSWTFLQSALTSGGGPRIPVIVQANKQDLPGALLPRDVAKRLSLGSRDRVIAASALEGDGVRATFLAALDAARDMVRVKIRRDGVEALAAPMETSAHLYEAMLREAEATPDPAVARALDEALASFEAHDGAPTPLPTEVSAGVDSRSPDPETPLR